MLFHLIGNMRDFILNSMEDSHVVKSVRLRGSYLYGTQTHLSDYDIYVIIDDSLENDLSKWGTIEEDGYAHRHVTPKFDVVTMTVKQLIEKLEKMPEDAIVFVENDSLYIDGSYMVTSNEIEYFDCDNTVVIGTDYKHREE